MNEELKKIAEKYNWKLEVWHGEYKGILCGIQETNPCEEPLPLYRFPGGVSLAQYDETMKSGMEDYAWNLYQQTNTGRFLYKKA